MSVMSSIRVGAIRSSDVDEGCLDNINVKRHALSADPTAIVVCGIGVDLVGAIVVI